MSIASQAEIFSLTSKTDITGKKTLNKPPIICLLCSHSIVPAHGHPYDIQLHHSMTLKNTYPKNYMQLKSRNKQFKNNNEQ